jgi:hypothetical protein
MTKTRNGDVIVAESFLEIRAKLLEVAATLDRIDRGSEHQPLGSDAHAQRALLGEATQILLREGPNRAQELQQLFSRGYETDWREQFGINTK